MEKQTSSQDLQSVPQCRLTAGPEADQQAGDDRAVRLNLDAVLVVAEQMPAAQDVLEESEEDLDRPAPAILIQHRDRLRRHIQQVRGDPEHAIGAGPRGAAPVLATLGVGRCPNLDDTDRVVRSVLPDSRCSDGHDLVAEHTGCQIGSEEFTRFSDFEVRVEPPLRPVR